MENQINELLSLISSSFPTASFEVVHNSFSPTLKHFIIRDADGEKGFGTDHDYKIAIEKAYSEFIERKTFSRLHKMFGNFKTSNGFSAHKNVSYAKQASINELIERDAFLSIWHAKIGPYWLSDDEIKSILSIENLVVFSTHLKLGFKISVGIVGKHEKLLTCIVKVRGNVKGKDVFYIDTKTGSDLIKVQNDLIEGISFYSHFVVKGKFKSKSLKKIDQPIDHFFYYLNNSLDINWFHKGATHLKEINAKEIQTYVIHPESILELGRLNRIVCYSESDLMQSYYCGKFSKDNINLKRFFELFGNNAKINKKIHPLS